MAVANADRSASPADRDDRCGNPGEVVGGRSESNTAPIGERTKRDGLALNGFGFFDGESEVSSSKWSSEEGEALVINEDTAQGSEAEFEAVSHCEASS